MQHTVSGTRLEACPSWFGNPIYDKRALYIHHLRCGYEIFGTWKFPTSNRTSDVRRWERERGRGILPYVICLLPSLVKPLNTTMLSHAPSTFIKIPTLDFVGLGMCMYDQVFSHEYHVLDETWAGGSEVSFLECCCNTLNYGVLRLLSGGVIEETPTLWPVGHIQNHCLPARYVWSISGSGMEWPLPHTIFTGFITVFAEANHWAQTLVFKQSSSVTAGKFLSITLK